MESSCVLNTELFQPAAVSQFPVLAEQMRGFYTSVLRQGNDVSGRHFKNFSVCR